MVYTPKLVFPWNEKIQRFFFHFFVFLFEFIEHEAFLQGLRAHGRNWKQVATFIPSRTIVQIRTHAQKYFAKLTKVSSEPKKKKNHIERQSICTLF